MLVNLLPLVTIETDSTLRIDLQYLASWPKNLGFMKGSPPAKFIFFHSGGCEEGYGFLSIFEGPT